MLQYWRILALTFALMAVGAYQLYGTFSNEGYAPQQPIAFSHVLHAGVMKMECLYCHSSAEKGAHAGVPSVDLCMGCHALVQTGKPEIQKLTKYYESGKPVPWVRIHRLPDHAVFNHKWHLAAGVACQTCHGPIQEMPVVRQWQKLEMGKCMECHRQNTYLPNEEGKGIYHPPTYHEAPVTEEERHLAAGEYAALQKEGSPAFTSAKHEFERYASGLGWSEEDERVIVSRLAEYRKDIYQHGRGAQLRGQNASVECSTCHH